MAEINKCLKKIVICLFENVGYTKRKLKPNVCISSVVESLIMETNELLFSSFIALRTVSKFSRIKSKKYKGKEGIRDKKNAKKQAAACVRPLS